MKTAKSQNLDMYPSLATAKSESSKEVWLKRGAALMKSKKFTDAIALFNQSLKKLPNDAQLHYCKGVAHHYNKELLQAIGCYSQALTLKFDFADAFENLAEAQFELMLFDDALLSSQASTTLRPKKAENHIRLARAFIRLGRYDEAINAATQALTLSPLSPSALMMRSNAYRGLNQLSHSISDLRLAIHNDPSNLDLVYNLSFDLLLNEEFDEGWQLYETRFHTKSFLENVAPMVSPRWNGKDNLNGKTILICPEQGLGDQIQYGRYALLLQDMGAKVMLAVAPPIVEIMQSMSSQIFVTSALQAAANLPAHDLHVPLMSLPGLFHTTPENTPCVNKYITPHMNIASKWAEKFSQSSKLQVGIAWSGSQLHVNDHNRSMSLTQLKPLFELNVDWHVLQTEIRSSDEVEMRQLALRDWRDDLTSLHETAGLIEQLDLLITVDTSVAHLSAAQGKPTWLMLPFAPDFRWLLNRSDTPWYPSMHLFRQPNPMDWESVVKEIFTALSGAGHNK